MPVSIVTSLLLWSALLLPGAKAEPSQSVRADLALCRSVAMISADQTTIQSWPIDESVYWTISEADSEEEDSRDGGDEVIVSEDRWNPLHTGPPGKASTIRLDRGAVWSPIRSSILRC